MGIIMKLDRSFYLRSGLKVAPELIGKQIVHHDTEGTTKGIIVEVEAYIGPHDAASHAYRSLYTDRTAIQYGEGGFAYIYTIYGVNRCMNIVVNRSGFPEVILIRALHPSAGLELMKKRRKQQSIRDLCNGPGKLSQAMGIGSEHYGLDLCGDELYIEDIGYNVSDVAATKRINIDYAGDAVEYLWRFVEKDSKFISVPPRR